MIQGHLQKKVPVGDASLCFEGKPGEHLYPQRGRMLIWVRTKDPGGSLGGSPAPAPGSEKVKNSGLGVQFFL